MYNCPKWGAAVLHLQVALGDCNELLDADYQANKLPAGKHSTKGLGLTGPDPRNCVTLLVFKSQILYWSWGKLWKCMSCIAALLLCTQRGSQMNSTEEFMRIDSHETWKHLQCITATRPGYTRVASACDQVVSLSEENIHTQKKTLSPCWTWSHCLKEEKNRVQNNQLNY